MQKFAELLSFSPSRTKRVIKKVNRVVLISP